MYTEYTVYSFKENTSMDRNGKIVSGESVAIVTRGCEHWPWTRTHSSVDFYEPQRVDTRERENKGEKTLQLHHHNSL